MRFLLYILLTFLLVQSVAVLGQESSTPASKAVDVGFPFEEFVETAKTEFAKSFILNIEQKNPSVAALFAQRPDVRAAATNAGAAEFAKQYRLITIPAAKSAVTFIYARTFTVVELERMFEHHSKWGGAPDAEYNKTPLGQKEIGLSNQVASAMMAASQASLPEMMPSVMVKIQSAIQSTLAHSGPKK